MVFLFKDDNAVWFHQSLHYLDLNLEKFSHIPWLSVMYLTNRFTVSARVNSLQLGTLIHLLCARHGWSSNFYYMPGPSKGVKYRPPGLFLVVNGLKFQTLGIFRYDKPIWPLLIWVTSNPEIKKGLLIVTSTQARMLGSVTTHGPCPLQKKVLIPSWLEARSSRFLNTSFVCWISNRTPTQPLIVNCRCNVW